MYLNNIQMIQFKNCNLKYFSEHSRFEMGGRPPGRPKGRNRKVRGRPPAGVYSNMTVQDKALYHRDKAREAKGYDPPALPGSPPAARLARESGVFNRGELNTNPVLSNPGPAVGRPPLDRIKGAMDPETLKERKRHLMKESYKKDKISKARRNAVQNRNDRKETDLNVFYDNPATATSQVLHQDEGGAALEHGAAAADQVHHHGDGVILEHGAGAADQVYHHGDVSWSCKCAWWWRCCSSVWWWR